MTTALRRLTFFDANTWIGRWPFSFAPAFTPRTLRTHLSRHGIARALVSPLDAVFQPEPGPANRILLRTTRGHRGLVPVPVINPGLGNWEEELDRCARDPRVRAVRVLPAYHAFRLDGPEASALTAALTERGLRLIVQVQLIDARHEFHAMELKPVPAEQLKAFLRSHRELPVLASGLMRPELKALAPAFPHLLCDLSFAEWYDTLGHLTAKVDPRQLAFASHTPFLIAAAARAKLDSAALQTKPKQAVAAGNLERFLAG